MKEIFINKQNDMAQIVLVENGNLIEKYEENDKIKRLEGKIYLGKVQNVLQGMQAAFVDIGEDRNTFIHLKDVLPKVDILEQKKEKDEKNIKELVQPGDNLLIQVKRDATNMKGAKVSTHISISGRYFVLMPEVEIKTISQKIEDTAEKKRLIEIVNEIVPQAEDWKIIKELNLLNSNAEILYKNYNMLSGGEQVKILLISLFLKTNNFLLIDEPTNHLDAETKKNLVQYLKNKKGFILVSHDRKFLDEVVDHIISINNTNIEIQSGNYTTWKENYDRQTNFEIKQNEKLSKSI